MNSKIPHIHQTTPTPINPLTSTQSSTQLQGMTSHSCVPTGTHTPSLGTLTRTVRLSQTDKLITADTSTESDYDLHVSTVTENRETTAIPLGNTSTSTPQDPFSELRIKPTSAETDRTPSPPPYDSATSLVTEAQLSKHLDDLVKENACLRKDNRKSIEAIQQTTATNPSDHTIEKNDLICQTVIWSLVG